VWHRVARSVSLAALVAGIGVGLFTYYGPTGMACQVSTSVTVRGDAVTTPTPAPMECRPTRLADSDQTGRALAFLAVWSLAPGLAFAGSFGPQRLAVTLASVAFVVELLSILGAMSVGFLYFLLVMPLTGLALFTAAMPRRRVQ
jgi:hypothetical protein